MDQFKIELFEKENPSKKFLFSDIDIFDSTFNWIIHIDHEGFINFIK